MSPRRAAGGGRLSFLNGAGSGGEGKGRASSSRRRRDGPGARQEEANGTSARPGSSRGSRTAPASSKCSGPGGGPRWGRLRPGPTRPDPRVRRRSSCRARQALSSAFAQRFVRSPRASLFPSFMITIFFKYHLVFNFLLKSWLWCGDLRALHLEGSVQKAMAPSPR